MFQRFTKNVNFPIYEFCAERYQNLYIYWMSRKEWDTEQELTPWMKVKRLRLIYVSTILFPCEGLWR